MWGKAVVAAGVAVLASVSPFAASPARAGTFLGDFTTGVDAKLVSTSNLKATPTLTVANGALQVADTAPGLNYDFGMERLTTSFDVTGDFVAHVTLQTTGIVQAGLEMFSGTAPARLYPNGALGFFTNDASIYGNSQQTIGYQRPQSYGWSTASYNVLDLQMKRTGGVVELLYDRGDGIGYRQDQPGRADAGLGGAVKLALYVANVQGSATATFSNYSITSASVADSAPAAVPEASTWASAIAGLGALGTAMRRRRRAEALAA